MLSKVKAFIAKPTYKKSMFRLWIELLCNYVLLQKLYLFYQCTEDMSLLAAVTGIAVFFFTLSVIRSFKRLAVYPFIPTGVWKAEAFYLEDEEARVGFTYFRA
ncbi:hypothetical protein HUO09_17760 [Vibrio sp. Y2-5]|uniref:hypothetical protein n=1 Tax=Vibrio sp. Y2-5 TaxID=2743977 RepID=UPI0016608F08|nr:hypothetical protein [Vibrio sp. Y2-5]MBD0788205.1 hypothetical protein [Vibrio sp. Y2-5]